MISGKNVDVIFVKNDFRYKRYQNDDKVKDVPRLHEVVLPQGKDLETHLRREHHDEEQVRVVQNHRPLGGLKRSFTNDVTQILPIFELALLQILLVQVKTTSPCLGDVINKQLINDIKN